MLVISVISSLGLFTGCVHGDCYVSAESWLHGVAPLRTREGVPVIEVRASRWMEPDCAPGRRIWIEVAQTGVTIREPSEEEVLEGLPPTPLGGSRYDYDGVVVELIWEPSWVEIGVFRGSGPGATTTIECLAAPEGLPDCAVM
jgi:hypothetical protein